MNSKRNLRTVKIESLLVKIKFNKQKNFVIFPSKTAVSEQNYELVGRQKRRRKIYSREMFDPSSTLS